MLKAQVLKCPSSKPLALILSEYPRSDVDGDADACPLWRNFTLVLNVPPLLQLVNESRVERVFITVGREDVHNSALRETAAEHATAIHNWRKAPVENASSERREQHTIERAVTVSCSESQESPASSKQKAHSRLDQWEPCMMFGTGEFAGAVAAAGFERLAKAAAQVQGQTGVHHSFTGTPLGSRRCSPTLRRPDDELPAGTWKLRQVIEAWACDRRP